MGWCHEFGVDIAEGCDHPMAAKGEACFCAACGTTCEGRFKGCARVWERGPLEIEVVRPPRTTTRGRAAAAAVSAPIDSPDLRARRAGIWVGSGLVDEGGTSDIALELEAATLVDVEPTGDPASRSDATSLGTAVERLRREMSLLEEALSAARPEGVPERVVSLAHQLPQRVGAIIARAIEADKPDSDQIERIEELIVATRYALELRSRRAPVANGQTATAPSLRVECTGDNIT